MIEYRMFYGVLFNRQPIWAPYRLLNRRVVTLKVFFLVTHTSEPYIGKVCRTFPVKEKGSLPATWQEVAVNHSNEGFSLFSLLTWPGVCVHNAAMALRKVSYLSCLAGFPVCLNWALLGAQACPLRGMALTLQPERTMLIRVALSLVWNGADKGAHPLATGHCVPGHRCPLLVCWLVFNCRSITGTFNHHKQVCH